MHSYGLESITDIFVVLDKKTTNLQQRKFSVVVFSKQIIEFLFCLFLFGFDGAGKHFVEVDVEECCVLFLLMLLDEFFFFFLLALFAGFVDLGLYVRLTMMKEL